MVHYTTIQLKGLYLPTRQRAQLVSIPTFAKDSERYPALSTVFSDAQYLTPRRTRVSVNSQGKEHFFHIHFRYSSSFGQSRAAREICEGAEWRGDILVLLCGSKADYVNIGGWNERRMAKAAVLGFLTVAQDLAGEEEIGDDGPDIPRELDPIFL